MESTMSVPLRAAMVSDTPPAMGVPLRLAS